MNDFTFTAKGVSRITSPYSDETAVVSCVVDVETLFKLSIALKAGYPSKADMKRIPCEPNTVWFTSPPVVVSAEEIEVVGDSVTLRFNSASQVIDDSALYRTVEAREKASEQGILMYLRLEIVISHDVFDAADRVSTFRSVLRNTVTRERKSSQVEEMIGKTYGFLTVLRRSAEGDPKYSAKNNLYCRCVCGTELCVSSSQLNLGISKSCGCRGRIVVSPDTKSPYALEAMHRVDEMIGKRYGMLTVLRRSQPGDVGYNQANNLYCRCDCGNERAVCSSRLSRGLAVSCGCANKRRALNDDLSGRRFGAWTVLGRAPAKVYGTSSLPMWKCRCDCGTVRDVSQRSLLDGSSRSCGCRLNLAETAGRIGVGFRFGKLTVIEDAEDYYGPHGKRYRRWKCRCDCGNEIVVKQEVLLQGFRTACYECQPHGRVGRKYETLTHTPQEATDKTETEAES